MAVEAGETRWEGLGVNRRWSPMDADKRPDGSDAEGEGGQPGERESAGPSMLRISPISPISRSPFAYTLDRLIPQCFGRRRGLRCGGGPLDLPGCAPRPSGRLRRPLIGALPATDPPGR